MAKKFPQMAMIQHVEKLPDVHLQNPSTLALRRPFPERLQRLVRRSFWPETKGRGIFSTASSGLKDGLGERRELERTAEAVAQVGIGAQAEFFRGLHQRREDVHRTGSTLAAAV